MGNVLTKTGLYSPSQIGNILKVARERACQEERRTKKYVSEQLGITPQRLNNIEEGFSECPFDLAIQWCEVVGDSTALDQIKHIYGIGLPATDPRLLVSVENQLVNFIEQSTQAADAAKKLLRMSTELRYGENPQKKFGSQLLEMAEQILDVDQAASCVLESMKQNWNLDIEAVFRSWTQEALSDEVAITVSEFEKIRKEQFFAEREAMYR